MWIRVLFINIILLGPLSADSEVPGINAMLLDPQLSMDQDGKALIVWNTGGFLGGQIDYCIRAENAENFTLPRVIQDMNTSSQYVSVDKNNKQEALVVWNTVTGHIFYAVYDDSTCKMGNARAMIGTGLYSVQPTVVLNDQGDGISVWSDADNNIQYASYHRIDKSFTKATTLPNAKTENELQVVLNRQGDGLLVWYDSVIHMLSYSVYDGKSDRFTVAQRIANTKDTLSASLVLNDKGDALLAWSTGSLTTPAGFLHYALYDKESTSFSTLRTLSSTKEGLAKNMMPQIAINNKGEAVLVWCQLTANGKDSILYALYDKGAKKFGPPTPLVGVAPYSMAPQIILNNQGEMLMTWFSTQAGVIQYSSYNKAKKAFSPAASVATRASKDEGIPQLAFNDKGEGIVVWGDLGAIKYSLYRPTTGQFTTAKNLIQQSP